MVGVYFDVGNNIRWGYAGHWVEVLNKRIGKLDIKEYSRKLQNDEGLRAGFNVEIGEGSVDWSRVRDELATINLHRVGHRRSQRWQSRAITRHCQPHGQSARPFSTDTFWYGSPLVRKPCSTETLQAGKWAKQPTQLGDGR